MTELVTPKSERKVPSPAGQVTSTDSRVVYFCRKIVKRELFVEVFEVK